MIKDLGFILDYKGDEGYLVFEHPELILEFLVPARGRERRKPYPLPQLGINAQALRFMDLLAEKTIQVLFNDVDVTVPHPANFAIHKLLIARRRRNRDKAKRDRGQSISVLSSLQAVDEFEAASRLYRSMPKTWQRTVKRELIDLDELAFIQLLERKPSNHKK